MKYTTSKYHIELYEEETLTDDSVDPLNQYNLVYSETSSYRMTYVYGIKVSQDDALIPLFFAYKLTNNSKYNNKELENLLKERGLK